MNNDLDTDCIIPSTTSGPKSSLVIDETKLKKMELILKILRLEYIMDIRPSSIQALISVPVDRQAAKISQLREKLTECLPDVELTVEIIDLNQPKFMQFRATLRL